MIHYIHTGTLACTSTEGFVSEVELSLETRSPARLSGSLLLLLVHAESASLHFICFIPVFFPGELLDKTVRCGLGLLGRPLRRRALLARHGISIYTVTTIDIDMSRIRQRGGHPRSTGESKASHTPTARRTPHYQRSGTLNITTDIIPSQRRRRSYPISSNKEFPHKG